MENWEAWIQPVAAVFFSLFLPYVVQLVKRSSWSKLTNWVIAIVVSLLAGVFTACVNGVPTPETLLTWITAVVGGVQVAYNLFKSIGVTSESLDKWFYFTSENETPTETPTETPAETTDQEDGVEVKKAE